jgi:hypothetical protein
MKATRNLYLAFGFIATTNGSLKPDAVKFSGFFLYGLFNDAIGNSDYRYSAEL